MTQRRESRLLASRLAPGGLNKGRQSVHAPTKIMGRKETATQMINVCLFDPRWALTYGFKPTSTLARCST